VLIAPISITSLAREIMSLELSYAGEHGIR
jgi:hypothetical protein